MASSLILTRTKPTAANDPDPTLGVFTPPETEVFKPSNLANGVRVALVYNAPGFTATVIFYVRDAATKTWLRAGSQISLGNRILTTKCNTGAHDIWIGLASIGGGNPIKIYAEEVD